MNVNLRAYYAEGSKTLAFEIAEQLGLEQPDVVVAPIASGALFSKVAQGFEELRRLGVADGEAPRLVGGQAAGCAPVATAFAEGGRARPVRPATVARSLAIGNPADAELALDAVRASGGTIRAVPEEKIGREMGALAAPTGVWSETAAGVTLGALRAAVAAGEVGRRDRVVLLVTGDGLKTPGPVADALAPVEVEADADALLDRLGVAA